jgi:hypothetical protein
MKRFAPLLVAALTLACAHAPTRPCRLAILPVSNAPADAAPCETVRTDCPLLPADALRDRLPPDLRTVEEGERKDLLTRLTGAADHYYEDPEAGETALEQAFARVAHNPALLPSDADARRKAYEALSVLLLARYDRGPEAGDEVARWLGTHLPDQVPSVKQLPPKLSARAADALEAAHKETAAVTAARPPGCPSGRLFLDGRLLGGLPVADTPLSVGRHALWAECGTERTWARLVDVHAPLRLPTADLAAEHALLLSSRGLALRPGTPEAVASEAGRRLLPSLDVDALLFLPAAGAASAPALLVTRRAVSSVPLVEGRYDLPIAQEVLRTHDWKRPTKWVATGLSALLLGAGMWAHYEHDLRIAEMDQGLVDNRSDAEPWKHAAVGSYSAAAATAAAAVTLFILDALPEEPIEPLF